MPGTDLRFTYLAKGLYWRFRHKVTGDVPLPRVKGMPVAEQKQQAAFMKRYAELLEAVERREKLVPVSQSSFAWLIGRYRTSAEFKALAPRTQADYDSTLDLLVAELGTVSFALATRAILKAVRDDHAATIRKAHKIKQMLSRLYSWADEQELVPAGFNPAKAIKRLKSKAGEREIVVWSDAEIEMILAAAPTHIRTIVLVALYTGQRCTDVARMTWKQFQGDIVRVRQSKTSTLLDIACHSILRRHLDALPRRAVLICTNAAGRPYLPNAMSKAIHDAVRSVPAMPTNRSMHGLRYAAGSRMEEAGCSVAEIESVLGHQTFKMALKYASQRLRAAAAMAKMEAAEG